MEEKWTKEHPLRPPNWRWMRANDIVESGGYIKRTPANDRYVVAATKLRRKLDAVKSEVIYTKFRDQYLAWKIYSDTEFARLRWELEARLIANQANDEIGLRLSLQPATVAYYESWFYNVKDRQGNIGYLYNQLVAPLIPSNPKETDYEMLWKFYGLRADGNVLDSLIYGFCDRAITDDANSVQAFWVESYQTDLNLKGALAAKLIKVDFNSYIRILDQRIKLLEATKEDEQDVSGQDSSVLYNIQVALEQTPWLEEKRRRDSSQIGGATLRADELIEMEYNEPSQEFVEVLESASYPVKDDD